MIDRCRLTIFALAFGLGACVGGASETVDGSADPGPGDEDASGAPERRGLERYRAGARADLELEATTAPSLGSVDAPSAGASGVEPRGPATPKRGPVPDPWEPAGPVPDPWTPADERR